MIIDKEIEKFSNANQMITGTERLTGEQTIHGTSQLKG
jgi:hypothetical protein